MPWHSEQNRTDLQPTPHTQGEGELLRHQLLPRVSQSHNFRSARLSINASFNLYEHDQQLDQQLPSPIHVHLVFRRHPSKLFRQSTVQRIWRDCDGHAETWGFGPPPPPLRLNLTPASILPSFQWIRRFPGILDQLQWPRLEMELCTLRGVFLESQARNACQVRRTHQGSIWLCPASPACCWRTPARSIYTAGLGTPANVPAARGRMSAISSSSKYSTSKPGARPGPAYWSCSCIAGRPSFHIDATQFLHIRCTPNELSVFVPSPKALV